ncbi:MAG TPA: TIGR01777 family oxidoreductase [Flavisolibacter sp.]|nr:TIGR01777 family oxidoreductase [Flavisolibacter sp.]
MATVMITGGTGMIGSALTKSLVEKGHQVIILTRNSSGKKKKENLSYSEWDPEKGTYNAKDFASADAIIHLAGANVAEKRWTEERKKEIIDSRVKSGELIIKALKEVPNRISTILSASAIGYYGPDQKPATPFREDAPSYKDFLGQTVRQWEASLSPIIHMGKRLVIFRTGIVLSREGGAFMEFEKPLHFGIASILGSGKQVISWIHIDDMVRLYIAALEDEGWKGTYNAVAPVPVTNKELILSIARQKNKVFLPIPVPSIVLKSLLGEMSIEVLKSTTVSSAKVEEKGFIFLYPTIDKAVAALLKH